MAVVKRTRDNQPELLSTGEAARLCAVKPDTVLKWIKRGRLEAVRTAGGHYRIQLSDIEPLIRGRTFGDLTAPPPPHCTPQPLRCWEYLSPTGEVPEGCKKCIVYRVRAAWCFQVAGLGRDVGHARHLCRTSCRDCAYYRRVQGLATHVLVISPDEAMTRRLQADALEELELRFARNAYEASAIIHTFRPGFVVLDRAVGSAEESSLLESLARDPRIPGVRVILATRPGAGVRRGSAGPSGVVAAILEKPFGARRVAAVIDSLPVETVAAK